MYGNISDPKNIAQAARVCDFLLKMQEDHPDRWKRIRKESGVCIPFGDMAYGMALMEWYKQGRPKNAFFSWAEGEIPDPFIIEFREELTKEFDLQIYTAEEAEIARFAYRHILETKVTDWGPN